MGGGPIIIIDPNKVKSSLSTEETVARLRETIEALETGAVQVESHDGDSATQDEAAQ